MKVFTSVGWLVNFWSKASDKLCAGSVDMIRTCKQKLSLLDFSKQAKHDPACERKNHVTYTIPVLAHLNCDGGRGGGLAHTTLAAYENPLEGCLLDDISECWLEGAR